MKDWKVEERLQVDARGWTISGKYDLWRPVALPPDFDPIPAPCVGGCDHPAHQHLGGAGGELIDFKVTSAWSFILEPTGVKPEWEAQLNLYAFMLRQHGTPVTKLTILAILRDWMKSKAMQDPDYPQVGFTSVDVPLWPVEKQEQFLNERVKIHQLAREGQYPGCTDEERWAKPEKFAAKKRGQKKAKKLFDDKFEAQQWVVEQSDAHDFVLELRPGKQTRCEDYCAAMPWCDQAKELGVSHD